MSRAARNAADAPSGSARVQQPLAARDGVVEPWERGGCFVPHALRFCIVRRLPQDVARVVERLAVPARFQTAGRQIDAAAIGRVAGALTVSAGGGGDGSGVRIRTSRTCPT